MTWNDFLSSLIKGMSRNIPYFKRGRIATVGVTNAEYLPLLGISYIMEIDMTIPDGESIWFRFTAPSDRDVQILSRELSPDIAGCEYNLYLGATGFSVGDVITPTRTNPIIGVTSTSSIAMLTTAPSSQGTHTTPIFSGKGGASNANGRPSGTDSNKSGLTSYYRGTGFTGRIRNSSGAPNRIVLRIEYAEMNDDLLRGIYS